jgi:hypothetical protein
MSLLLVMRKTGLFSLAACGDTGVVSLLFFNNKIE